MNVISKIARPCGIAGGIWGFLAPIIVLLPITVRGMVSPVTEGPGGKEWVSMVEAGVAGSALPILSFIALMGLLGLLAMVLISKQRLKLGRVLIWVSASAMLVVSLVSIFSLGLFFLLPSILLMLAAIGLRGSEMPSA
jgi:hypothetical protein